MRHLAIALLLLSISMPAYAAAPISREEGFARVWQSVRRPVSPVREAPFVDVPADAPRSPEITYAKARGILDDDEAFRPDDPLTVHDAALWLFRTRNVADPDDLSREQWMKRLTKYPLVTSGANLAVPLSEEELLTLARRFDDMLLHEVHEVSLYAEKFHGKGTAFGEAFNMYALTAAHRTFPHNTLVKVTNVDNGKSVVVRINDRGPYIDGRDMDLSLAAFTSIADRSRGKFNATFRRMGDSTLVGDCSGESPRQRRITKNTLLTEGVPHALPLGKTLILRSGQPFVMRGVRYPEDSGMRTFQDWILPGEEYAFTPSIVGEYGFLLGSKDGRRREMTMRVVQCEG